MHRACVIGVMLGLSVAPLAGASGALATETLPPVADYLKDPATDWVRLSPSGELYAMITREVGKNWFTIRMIHRIRASKPRGCKRR